MEDMQGARDPRDKTMPEDELKSILSSCAANSIGGLADTEIQKERIKSLKYYNAEPFGDEQTHRSSVISTDVRDTIESVLPSLLKIFTAGDDVVEFVPFGPEDEEQARQATDYVNWVFNQDNQGFLVLYTWFKDALIQKTGYVKFWWEKKRKVIEEIYSGLSDDELMMLASRPDVQVAEHSARPMEGMEEQLGPDGQPLPAPMLHDVKIRITEDVSRARVRCLPPEHVRIIRGAVDVDEAAYVDHQELKTISELIEEGYDAELLEQIPTGFQDWTDESYERNRKEDAGGWSGNPSNDPSMREVWITEAYIRVDYDGDGVAELRRVCFGGNADVILANEPIDMVPITPLTPFIMPHQFFGLSMADMVMEVQRIKSTIQRQMLDNLYLINNQRWRVDPMGSNTKQTIDDLLTSRPGGVIRAKQGEMEAMPQQSLPQSAFAMLEYMDTIRENRTGVTKYNQGLDADSLNKTATGINAIMNAAQQRMELIARVFAETGVKRLFRGLLALVTKHQDKPRMIRLRGKFVPMDPSKWRDNMDITVNVGLGTGNKDQMLQHLMNIYSMQSQIVQSQGGPTGPLVTMENLHATLSKIVENAGLKNPDLYFTPPPTPEQQAQQQQQQAQQPPPPDPKQQELAMKAEASDKEIDLERYKFDKEHALKHEDMLLKHGVHPEYRTPGPQEIAPAW